MKLLKKIITSDNLTSAIIGILVGEVCKQYSNVNIGFLTWQFYVIILFIFISLGLIKNVENR